MTTIAKRDRVVRVWGLRDWASYYGPDEKLDPHVEDILQSPCPFHKYKLVGETHFAFMGIRTINGDLLMVGNLLTVAKWIELHPGRSQPKFCLTSNPWHVGQPYITGSVLEPRLYIMLREIVPGSRGKTPEEQAAMLPSEYEVSSTIAEVTKDILVFRKTGKYCNPSCWAACKERTVGTPLVASGQISCVGLFLEDGLHVEFWDGQRNNHMGVSASRKL